MDLPARVHIGMPVVFIKAIGDRNWNFPAVVTGFPWGGEGQETLQRPTIRVCYLNTLVRYEPPGVMSRLLLMLGYDFGLISRWDLTDSIQHRDTWHLGGGDDMGEYWCYPEEGSDQSYTWRDRPWTS